MHLTSQYNTPLVILSIVIAIISSYTALSLANRLIVAKGYMRNVWVVAGAISLGFGIWSMHFIAMLAFHLEIQVTYNLILVILSIILAVVSCGIAFFIVSKGLRQKIHMSIGAFFIGTGIVSMHYVGMASMQMNALITYDLVLLLLSFSIAFGAAFVALYLLFYFQTDSNKIGVQVRKTGSAIIMGIAIAGMHYTGMAAASFHSQSNHTEHTFGLAVNNTAMAYGVGLGMFVILAFVVTGIYSDKRFQLKSSELEFIDNMYQTVVMSANDAVMLCDAQGIIIAWNSGAEKIFGYKATEAIGQSIQIIIPEDYREAHEKGMKRYIETKNTHVIGKTVELQGLRKNGNVFPIELSISTFNKDKEIFFSGIIRDISERKKAEEKITELVYRDPLTNLPNRRFLNNHLVMCIEQAAINDQLLAVMFIDLDRFKTINDTLGHGAGDRLLVEVAKRMKSCIEKKDMLSRQGGDEYILVFPNTTHKEVANVAKKLLETLSHSFVLDNNELFISGSIGISMYPEDGTEVDVLIKNADTSMYRAKELGKNNYQFFTADLNNIIADKMNLEMGLRKALEKEEFELYYQPQVHVKTGKIKGVEALLRWNHEELGLVSPNDFIPLAEETGLIVPIGKWVMKEACRQATIWQEDGHTKLRVSLNISALQFQQPDFVETVEEILNTTGLEARYLELELTESIVQNPAYALPIMEKLKAMGVTLSLDDFGTGYSSLSYLRSFPLDTLKIDKLFIDNIHDHKDAAIVKTIISMANSLNMNVIAEGVETPDQLNSLYQYEGDEYQGYLFSKPVSSTEFQKFIEKRVKV